ncbi:hypothetical protein AB685_19370 [Bacillus sp. LL01]|uniref:hypothetical protein n=1 Tax=Bacillus sp. LL01 TaxID=1665556 RepID=UPI00064CEAB3|nr:hypothetical protein [Bacillus sp. LL01]KMJ56885.1 hypothetical protein AB685_19370 [Bacillus sp. LL01]
MFKNKPALYVSVLLILIAMIMSFPFKLSAPYGPELTVVLGIPTRTVEGPVYFGMLIISILILGLVFLGRAMKKYRGRAVLLAVLLFVFGPFKIAETYQNTFASGIDAISYDREKSKCTYESMDRTSVMTVHCELYFQNHSEEDVTFMLTFYEEEHAIWSHYLNNEGPLEVTVFKQDRNPIIVKRELKLEKEQLFSGSDSYFSVILEAEGKKRTF